MENLKSAPVIIQNISINGIKNTKDDFIKKQLHSERIFAARTMGDVIREVKLVEERLLSLDIFDTIKGKVDAHKSNEKNGDGFARLQVDFDVKERKLRKFEIKGMCGLDNIVGINLELISRNLFGRAAELDFNYHNNFRGVGGQSVTLTKPLEGIPRIKLKLCGWNNSLEHRWSKFSESSTGCYGEVMLKSILGQHQCRFETMSREVVANEKAPVEIQKENGSGMKSSIKHIFTRGTNDYNHLNGDIHDSSLFPESGYQLSLLQEIFSDHCRVSDDTPLNLNLKLEAELKKSFNIRQFVVENTFGCGLIRSLTTDVTQVPIPDRYFIGGPLTMRGYELRSMGPLSSDGVPIGSNYFFQHGCHVYSAIPYLSSDWYAKRLRLHGFITSATTSPFNELSREMGCQGDNSASFRRPTHQVLRQYLSTFRCTAGLGIILRVSNNFRLEINYCVPLRTHPSDRLKFVDGFQFGIGVLYV